MMGSQKYNPPALCWQPVSEKLGREEAPLGSQNSPFLLTPIRASSTLVCFLA